MVEIQREGIVLTALCCKGSLQSFFVLCLTCQTVLVGVILLHGFASPDKVLSLLAGQCDRLSFFQGIVYTGKIVLDGDCDTPYHIINALDGTHIYHRIPINLSSSQQVGYRFDGIFRTSFCTGMVSSHGMCQRDLHLSGALIASVFPIELHRCNGIPVDGQQLTLLGTAITDK